MSKQKNKILIIEDEPAILRALASVFKRDGFEVVTAEDGDDGLELALRECPSLILFDIVMPRMDGLTMLSRLRQEGGDWGKTVKAIAYTNMGYNESKERARSLGVSDYLIKANVRLAEVVSKAEELLGVGPRKD